MVWTDAENKTQGGKYSSSVGKPQESPKVQNIIWNWRKKAPNTGTAALRWAALSTVCSPVKFYFQNCAWNWSVQPGSFCSVSAFVCLRYGSTASFLLHEPPLTEVTKRHAPWPTVLWWQLLPHGLCSCSAEIRERGELMGSSAQQNCCTRLFLEDNCYSPATATYPERSATSPCHTTSHTGTSLQKIWSPSCICKDICTHRGDALGTAQLSPPPRHWCRFSIWHWGLHWQEMCWPTLTGTGSGESMLCFLS